MMYFLCIVQIVRMIVAGERVRVPWTDGKYYFGNVESLQNGKTNILFDDGDNLKGVSVSKLIGLFDII